MSIFKKYMMTPGIRPGESPPFYRMDEYTFQNLSRDLFDAEPNIVSCEVYGVRGQAQDGIDLLAHRKFGDGIEVGQCKCFENFSDGQISQVSDEFFKYWNRWSRENVKRFILFVACDLNRRQQQDEILNQRKRFESLEMAYEVWAAAKIRNKLRPHPGIVTSYFSHAEYWVKDICGAAPLSSSIIGGMPQSVVFVGAALIGPNNEREKQIEQQLKDMRLALREGHKHEVLKWVNDVKSNEAQWLQLTQEIKAQILLFEASLKLDNTNNLSLVKNLADEARDLAPSIDQTRLRVLIAHRENNIEAALKLLGNKNDIDSLNLKAAILLEKGLVNECHAILNFIDSGLNNDEGS